MPYANNKGVKIHYEVEGRSTPLMLVHGFGSNLKRGSFERARTTCIT